MKVALRINEGLLKALLAPICQDPGQTDWRERNHRADLKTGRDHVPSPLEAVSTYFYAKDGNRPFLMRRAFAEHVHLEMVVKTEAISFPSSAKGVAAIEEILCRRFANDFENIYTFCLAQPTEANRRHYPCHWLVGMSAKNNGPIRVGSGRYDGISRLTHDAWSTG
jgi:hypothetical protein